MSKKKKMMLSCDGVTFEIKKELVEQDRLYIKSMDLWFEERHSHIKSNEAQLANTKIAIKELQKSVRLNSEQLKIDKKLMKMAKKNMMDFLKMEGYV